MFENLVHQSASKLISADIKTKKFPGSVLFAGSESSGKLTAAFETARVLSCQNSTNFGKWICECPSCKQHKSLISSNILLMGPRDCSLEIGASKEVLLNAVKANASYIVAARYLFIRSVRKLVLRFDFTLWRGESNYSKISKLLEDIDDGLELIDISRNLPEYDELEKICENLYKLSVKLENEYLYDSIPINQIRNMEEWAHLKTDSGKKTIIIENADRMAVSVRNALLKILEEPPEDCVFILLTSKRNAIMQTILSRVRTYNFMERNSLAQKEVISRVFHNEEFNGTINDFLLKYLPVNPDEIKNQAEIFYKSIVQRQIPDLKNIISKCDNFYSRVELKIFLNHIANLQRKLLYTHAGTEASALTMNHLRNCWDNITLYNLTSLAALEILLRELSVINVTNGGVFK